MKWFKHITKSFQDAKIEKLIMKYGLEGYGLYFACIEMIAGELSNDNITFELEHDSEILSRKFNVTQNKIEEIMKYCIELKLFEINPSSQHITCFKLIKYLDESTIKSKPFNAFLSKIYKSGLNRESFRRLSGDIPESFRRLSGQNRIEKKRIEKKRIEFIPPTISEIENYGKERGYKINAEQIYHYYADNNPPWTDRDGNPVKNWKGKLNSVWFKEENKIKPVAPAPREPVFIPPDTTGEMTPEQKAAFSAKIKEALKEKGGTDAAL